MQNGSICIGPHTLTNCTDLIFEDFEKHLKVHQVTIKKGRRITTFIYGRIRLISMLKKFTKERDLIRPNMTRVATTYFTLASVQEMKALLRSRRVKNKQVWNFTREEKTKIWF